MIKETINYSKQNLMNRINQLIKENPNEDIQIRLSGKIEDADDAEYLSYGLKDLSNLYIQNALFNNQAGNIEIIFGEEE